MKPNAFPADRRPRPRAPRRLPRGGRTLLAVVLVLGAGLLAALAVHRAGGPEAITGRLGPAAPLLIVPLLAAISTTPLPSEILAIPAAGLYGLWRGAALVWVAWVVAAYLQYLAAQLVARDWELQRARDRLPAWLARLPVSHPLFLICARWFPLGPHLVNTAAGVCNVGLARHGWCAAVGIAPQALFISAVGNALLSL
jgi:uncharacterized membrane protein YdjX (TVP38/TMEM64 family)